MKKRTVRQVGYLQGLNRDARSTENKNIALNSLKSITTMKEVKAINAKQ